MYIGIYGHMYNCTTCCKLVHKHNRLTTSPQSHYKSKYIASCQQSHTPSYTVRHRIFVDVDEKEKAENKRLLFRETNIS